MATNVPNLPQPQQIGQHQQQQPPQPSDLDAIHNKLLIPQLRESIAVCIALFNILNTNKCDLS
jgi:hypothetical protein